MPVTACEFESHLAHSFLFWFTLNLFCMWEVDPKETGRAKAFDSWMKAVVPMVTIFKTLDVSRLVRLSKKNHLKFNMLMCFCVVRAASRVEEFYMLPMDGKLMRFDKLAVSVVVNTKAGGITTCDVPFIDDIRKFNSAYLELTQKVYESGEEYCLDNECMVVGTSALVKHELDGMVNIYAGFFNNPFLAWAKYRKGLFKVKLPVSFQFHHTQMDGGHAAMFLDILQKEIASLKV